MLFILHTGSHIHISSQVSNSFQLEVSLLDLMCALVEFFSPLIFVYFNPIYHAMYT